MSQGKVVELRQGLRGDGSVYARIKNGAVYRFPRKLSGESFQQLSAAITGNSSVIRLKYWIPVLDRHGKKVSP